MHTPLTQSETEPQFLVAAHLLQLPPQSMSLSLPFFTPSVQIGAWHTLLVHTPLTQSELPVHALPAEHLPQPPPPQSTSVSLPFLTPSVQIGALHVPPEQTLLAQSVFVLQVWPVMQPGQDVPPQSTAVSVPFLTLSVQIGAWHVFVVVPLHTPLTQSPAIEQVLPVAHAPQLPPQSVSVSVPFLTPSAQVAV